MNKGAFGLIKLFFAKYEYIGMDQNHQFNEHKTLTGLMFWQQK